MLKVLADIFISLVCCKFTCEFVVLTDVNGIIFDDCKGYKIRTCILWIDGSII